MTPATRPGLFYGLGAYGLWGVFPAFFHLLAPAAAQRLPLVTLGLLQYLTPSMQLVWGLVVDHEPMPATRWLGFTLIWIALAICAADGLHRARRDRTGTLLACDDLQSTKPGRHFSR